ncbi:MAG: VIT domain-containing protein [Steroidobacter sp.]
MRDLRPLPLILLALIGATEAMAQPAPVTPNPALVARVEGVDDEVHRRHLPISDLDVDVRVVGAIARATLRIHFANPTDEQLEGVLSLALPDSAVVTHYALDVEGNFIDGVLTEPSRARAAYEQRVRRAVDPGLAEVSRSNVFSTRVYPVDEEGRTVGLSFVAPIHSLKGWTLPLVTEQDVGRVTLSIHTTSLAAPPELVLPAQLRSQWLTQGDGFVLKVSAANTPLSGELRLNSPRLTQPLLTTSHPNGKRFFQLNEWIPMESTARRPLERVRIYWDRSRSRVDDDLESEIDLVTRYLETTRPRVIDVVSFDSSGVIVETFSNAATVQAQLRNVTYRGATSFAMLQAANVADADVCLLFSDGVGTIDDRQTFKPDCDMFAVTTALDADVGYLALVTKRSADMVLRLDRDAVDDVLARLLDRDPAVVEVLNASGAQLSFASLPAARGEFAVVGEAPPAGDIIVRIGGHGSRIIERRYPISRTTQSFEGAGALWGADQVMQLAARERTHELRKLSQRFSVASPHLSFVVLEDPSDYVQARIRPPTNYPAEWREEYDALKAETDQYRRTERDEHLANVIEQWQEHKRWWQEKFDPAASRRERSAAAPSPRGSLEEIAVTGSRARKPGATIELAPWNVNRSYIKALDATDEARLDSVLAAEEKTHGDLPAFYLDVAEWFHRRGDTERAAELLLSALELPAKNDETISIVAERLLRYGQLDRAIWLYQRLLELAPDRPQPARSLALALAERAKHGRGKSAARDLERAVTILNQVIITPWDDAYDGIELISLMEANALLPQLKQLGVRKAILDSRLVAPLAVDLRVVIEWNTPATDMDLWVTEPNGESAMYSNNRTALGGHLSNDMTSGFGPEEYLLRRAPDGRFAVGVNVFSADPLNPNGATMLTARLTHNFGRPNQRTETLDIELSSDSEGEIPIGTFVLAGKGLDVTAAAPRSETDQDEE